MIVIAVGFWIYREVQAEVRRQEEATRRAEVQRVERLTLSHQEKKIQVTLSVGVATVGEKHADWTAFVSSADHALLRAKEKGRNRVED